MEAETVVVTREEYDRLLKKSRVADDLLIQLEASLRDAEAGRIQRVA